MRKLFFSIAFIVALTIAPPISFAATEVPIITDEQLNEMAQQQNWDLHQIQGSEEALPIHKLADEIFKQTKQKKATFSVDISRTLDRPGETAKDIESKINESVYQAIKVASQKDEELSYDTKKYSFSYLYWSDRVDFTFYFEYGQTLEQDRFVEQRVKEIASSIIKPSMNDHEKVKAVHDYIILNTAYDESLNQAVNNPYHLLTKGTSLCGGYSRTAALLLKEAGIPARVISGTSRGVGHAWNLVKVDGHWFHLDVTWDDPIPDVPGRIYYDYFLLPDKPLRKTHFWTDGGLNRKDAPYPKATTVYEQLLEEKGMRSFARELGIHSVAVDTEEEMIELFQETINKYDPELSLLVDKNMTKAEARAIVDEVNKANYRNVKLSFIFPNDDSSYTDSRNPDKKRFTLFIKHNYVPTVTSLKPSSPWPTIVDVNKPLHLNAQATWDNKMSHDVTNDVDLHIQGKNNNFTRVGSTLYFQGSGPIDILMSYKGKSYKHSLIVQDSNQIEEPSSPPEEPGELEDSEEIQLPNPSPQLKNKLKPYVAFSKETPTVKPTKVWTIEFNATLRKTNRSSVQLFNHEGKRIEASVQLSTKQPVNELIISPKKAYQKGDRIYVLLNDWADHQGNSLSQPIYFDFFVQ